MTRKWFGLLIVAGMAVYSALVLPALPAELPTDPVQAMLIGLGLLFVGIGPLLPRFSPNRWAGIRTPWTLSSDTVWRRTHRVGGYICAFSGLLIVTAGFLPHPTRLWVSALAFVAMVMIPTVYSYLVWREVGER